jgi:hypothetical protein
VSKECGYFFMGVRYRIELVGVVSPKRDKEGNTETSESEDKGKQVKMNLESDDLKDQPHN